jgi:hypothetical protein
VQAIKAATLELSKKVAAALGKPELYVTVSITRYSSSTIATKAYDGLNDYNNAVNTGFSNVQI